MNTEHIRAFVAAAEAGSISKAAYQKYISHTALSKQLRLLEQEIGVPLMERSPSGITLTPAGRHFLEWAAAFLESFETVRKECLALQGAQKEEICVFYTPVLTADLAVDVCGAYQKEHPEVEFRYISLEGSGNWERERFEDPNALWESIDYVEKSGEFRFVPVLEDTLCLLVPPKHPLAERTEISVRELKGEKVHGYEPGMFLWNDQAVREVEEAGGVIIRDRLYDGSVKYECIQRNELKILPTSFAGDFSPMRKVKLTETYPVCLGMEASARASDTVRKILAFAKENQRGRKNDVSNSGGGR